MKKIIAVLTAFSLAFSGLIINTAANSVYDSFGTAALGPSAPVTESDYSALGKAKKLEKKKLPKNFDYNEIKGLRIEAQQKLNEFQPLNIGQASRISGVTPADVSVLLVFPIV